jgi:RNA polymerase subunit RPABC4/transcription elongation factor Spt4
MITCDVCGHLNSPSRATCENCGSDLSDSPDWDTFDDNNDDDLNFDE